MVRRFPALSLGLFIFISDILTKFLVQSSLSRVHFWYPYGGIGVFKDFLGIEFSIVHAINKGAAWGIFSEWQQQLLYFRILLVVGLFVYLLLNKKSPRVLPLTCILAGAAGNVIDFFLYGHVIDMLHFVLWGYDYPVFNIADCAIFIGICWLLMQSLREKPAVSRRKV